MFFFFANLFEIYQDESVHLTHGKIKAFVQYLRLLNMNDAKQICFREIHLLPLERIKVTSTVNFGF